MGKHLIKRHGHTEEFDERKVYASIYAASLNCHMEDVEAEDVAEDITERIKKWIEPKELCRSHDIREQVIELLSATGNKDVGLMYKHHLDLS